jgi:hypothetical protein
MVSSDDQKDAGGLAIADAELWDNPTPILAKLALARVRAGVSGLAIAAPSQVSVDDRTTAPLALLATGKLLTLMAHPLQGEGVILAMDVEHNTLHFVFISPRDNAEPVDFEGVSDRARSSRQLVVDLREQLELPWRPANYRVTAILRDWCSNRVELELARGPHIYADEEVERFLAGRAQQSHPRLVGADFPRTARSFGATAESPQLPDGTGLAVTVERVVVAEPGAQCWLHASVRVPIPATDLVRPRPSDHRLPYVGDDAAKAVIGVWVLAVASDRGRPIMLPLGVPAYDEPTAIDSNARTFLATGHFRVDMLAFDSIARSSQTWFIYVMSAGELIGPIPMAVVGPDKLRTG